MISYQQAKKILKDAKIEIYDEYITVKNSLNRVVAKDILFLNHPMENNVI